MGPFVILGVSIARITFQTILHPNENRSLQGGATQQL
jgi:hypothetical protein